MTSINYSIPCSLAIGLGANLPSHIGPPQSTLIAIRPILEKLIFEWINSLPLIEKNSESIADELAWNWSPLFSNEPIGGPPNQPSYINAVLFLDGNKLSKHKPSKIEALDLLDKFLLLEKQFGRDRKNTFTKWGPRTLDIDFLAWGDLQIKTKKLTLPHPRLIERNFVITPLAAALSKNSAFLTQIAPQPGWNE